MTRFIHPLGEMIVSTAEVDDGATKGFFSVLLKDTSTCSSGIKPLTLTCVEDSSTN